MTHPKKATFTSSWSDLPKEIISRIERRLDNAIDLSRLRSVCKSWHASRNPDKISILSPFLPWTFTNTNLPFSTLANTPVTLIARAVFLVKPLQSSPSSRGWLLTVEERIAGKLHILKPFSTNRVQDLPSNFPKYLDLSKFEVSEVARSYCFKYSGNYSDVADVKKVVLCSGSLPTAMVLYGKGTLIGVRLKTEKWGYVRNSLIRLIKDAICFKGMIYAVDRYLNVLVIDYKTMNVTDRRKCGSKCSSDRKIRLVEWNTELHLIGWHYKYISESRRHDYEFETLRMDETEGKWHPDNCSNSYTVVASSSLSSAWCFLAEIPGLNGDYILYSKDLPNNHYGKYPLFPNATMDLAVDVYFRPTGRSAVERSRWFKIAEWLWPPPIWFLPEQYTCPEDDENDEELNIQNPDISHGEHLLPPYLRVARASAAININKEAFGDKSSGRHIHVDGEDSHARTIQNLNQNHSTVVFEGVSMKSNLVPILEKVWAKYGNILDGCKIRGVDLIAGALESLATALLILQTNSGCSLNKIQADYLNSVLSDLQHMNFRVEWLVPFIEKALALQKNKPLIDSLKDFDRAKAQAEEMKLKVLDELAKVGEVEEDLSLVSEKLNVLKSMDFEQSLGEGLY